MVIGGTGGTLVHSTVIWVFSPRGRLLTLGRIGGRYGSSRLTGTLCCDFIILPSRSDIVIGAYTVVPGVSGGMLVHSTVLCTILHRGRGLTMGRMYIETLK